MVCVIWNTVSEISYQKRRRMSFNFVMNEWQISLVASEQEHQRANGQPYMPLVYQAAGISVYNVGR